MSDGLQIRKRSIGNHGDVIAMQREHFQLFQSSKCVLLDTLKVVIADDQG